MAREPIPFQPDAIPFAESAPADDLQVESFGENGAFVKLNWKSAQDGRWLNHTLECYSADDVFSILKAS